MLKIMTDLILDHNPVVPMEAATKDYVDQLAEGTDEVFVGPTQPLQPDAELWYDTDDVGMPPPLNQITADALYLNKAGDAMTGPLALAPPPTLPEHAVNKAYADTVGVPTGGAAGQVLGKVDGADYNVQWLTVTTLTAAANARIRALEHRITVLEEMLRKNG